MIAYIGLGSNLDDPVDQLQRARQAIGALPSTRQTACSRFYRSSPMGPTDQPDYVNAVLAIDTKLEAHDLLKALQAIEHAQGRQRTGVRWGPRTLDLDILMYGDRIIASQDLQVPHPGIPEREFVLYPLAEIADEDLIVPGFGALTDLVASCPRREIAAIDEISGDS